MNPNIAVIGAGSWGTALAIAFSRKKRTTLLWGRDLVTIQDIQNHRENKKYLPGTKIPSEIEATTDIEALKGIDIFVIATPAQYVRQTLLVFKTILQKGSLVLTSKGIEKDTGFLMTEVVKEVMPWKEKEVAVLSGPSYAHEVAMGLPTALTLASENGVLLENIQGYLSSPSFRLYRSLDPIGVQLGGALKNVLAIASGIVIGKGLGENARAALVTRGLSEIIRLGTKLGALPETFYGLSGLGDLLLTAMSPTSRNTSFGIELGKGKTKEEILKAKPVVIEGVCTVESLHVVFSKLGIEMPILSSIFKILQGSQSVEEAMNVLLTRPLKEENEK